MLTVICQLLVIQLVIWNVHSLIIQPNSYPCRACQTCGAFEERQICGPSCPMTCDTLNTNVCCGVRCVSGCFCKDGYILLSNTGPRKCVPLENCPKPGILEFANQTITVLESIKVILIGVLRINGKSGQIAVQWRTVQGTAGEYADFIPATGNLVFPDGVTFQTFTIEIIDDTIREPDEMFTVVLSDPTNRAEINPRRLEGLTVTIKDDDMKPGFIELSNPVVTVPEGVGTLTINVVRVEGSDGEIRCRYRTVDTTASGLSDYVVNSGELVFEEGETLKKVVISILDDDEREASESFRFELYDISASPDVINFRRMSRGRTATIITIADDDMTPGYLQLEKVNVTVNENIGTVEICIVRLEGTDGILQLKYKTVDGTAVNLSDYKPAAGELVFKDGESKKTISIEIFNDKIGERVETFQLQIYDISPGYGTINFRAMGSQLTALITIIDDEKPGYVEMEASTISAPENAGTVTAVLVRLEGSDGELRVPYKIVDISAVAGSDYKLTLGEVVFKDGETRKEITIEIIDDQIREIEKTFQIQLLDLEPQLEQLNLRSLGARRSTVVSIIDNDEKPGYVEMETATISAPENAGTITVPLIRREGSDGELRVPYKIVDVSAVLGSDYKLPLGEVVFKEGETRKEITIEIIDDQMREIAETFQIQLLDLEPQLGQLNFRRLGARRSTVVSIIDNDEKPGYVEMETATISAPENAGTITVALIRREGSDGELRVPYKIVDVSAVLGSDYKLPLGEVVFKEGETRKEITIEIIDDQMREIAETFQIQLLDLEPQLGQLNFRRLGARRSTVVSIIDNDEKPGYVEMETATISAPENAGTITVALIRREGSDGELSVPYKIVDVSAVLGSDYKLPLGEVVFKEGETRKEITIEIIDDQMREIAETFQIQLLDLEPQLGQLNFRRLGARRSTVVSIIDNDEKPGYVEMETATISAPENAGTITVALIRREGSDGELRVPYKIVDVSAVLGSDYKLPLGEVVFKEGETRKEITIEIIDDQMREIAETFQIQLLDLEPQLGQLNFRRLGARRSTVVSIIDNDEKPGYVEMETATISAPENAGTITVALIRREGSDGELRVPYKIVDVSAVLGSDYKLPLGEVVFKEGETRKEITIEIIDDQIREIAETFQIQLLDLEPQLGQLNFRRLGARRSTVISIIDNDEKPGYVEMETATISAPENCGTVTVTLIRREGSDGELRVPYKIVDVSAVLGSDYKLPVGEVVFKEGETRKEITIEIIDDQMREIVETFQIQLLDLEPQLGQLNFRRLGARRSTVVSIIDNDEKPGYVEMETATISAPENAGTITVALIRREGSDGELSVPYKIVDVSAVLGSDYKLPLGEVVFKEGETRKEITIEIIDDQIREIAETFQIQLLDLEPQLGQLNFRRLGARRSTVVSIIDNDEKPGYVEMETATISAPENCGTVTVALIRREGSDGELRVPYKIVDVSAVLGSDYKLPLGVVVFKEGETRKEITIEIIDDQIREIAETFQIQLLDLEPQLGQVNFRRIGARRNTVVSIIDNDENPGLVQFEREKITVREDVGVFEITVKRVDGTDGPLLVKYKVIAGTAVSLVDFTVTEGNLIFQDGVDKMTIKIRIMDDRIKEPDETFTVLLVEPEGIQSRRIGSITSLMVTITDNDNHPGVFEFQTIRISVSENARTVSVIILRKGGSNGLVTLQIRTRSGTATEGVDYNCPSRSIDFPDGITEQRIHLQIIDDDVKESDENFLVGIFNPSNGGSLGEMNLLTVVIIDDDEPSVIRFRRRTGSFRENNDIVEIPVIREKSLDKRVGVHWKTEDQTARAGEDYREISDSILIFEPNERIKTIRIVLLDDSQFEENELFDVVLFNPSQGAVLGIPSRYTVELSDNDARVVSQLPRSGSPGDLRIYFRQQNIRVIESAVAVRISIVRSGPQLPITVRIQTADGSAIGGEDYRRTRGPLTFENDDEELIIAIRIIDDNLIEPDETFTVELFNPSLGIIPFGLNTVTITIEDDDGDIAFRRRNGAQVTPDPRSKQSPGSMQPFALTKCPNSLILKTCANTCPPTCGTLLKKAPCTYNGCVRGCFCPDGLVKENESSERCIRPSQCPSS